MPPGATLSYAFRRILPDGVMDNLDCVVPMAPDEVEAFYRTSLERRGYKLSARGRTMDGSGSQMLFVGPAQDGYRVSLRPTDKGKMVRVGLVVWRIRP
jgi:hypothetical protein